MKVDMSVDLRHIYIIYSKELMNENFWEYVQQKIKRLNREKEFKDKLLTILRLAPEVGYQDVEIPEFILKILQNK